MQALLCGECVPEAHHRRPPAHDYLHITDVPVEHLTAGTPPSCMTFYRDSRNGGKDASMPEPMLLSIKIWNNSLVLLYAGPLQLTQVTGL